MTLSLATVTPLVSTAAAAMHAGVGATDAKRIAIADPSATISATAINAFMKTLLSLVRPSTLLVFLVSLLIVS
jgi:hypothetical protein